MNDETQAVLMLVALLVLAVLVATYVGAMVRA